jgi:hypothetical protein
MEGGFSVLLKQGVAVIAHFHRQQQAEWILGYYRPMTDGHNVLSHRKQGYMLQEILGCIGGVCRFWRIGHNIFNLSDRGLVQRLAH